MNFKKVLGYGLFLLCFTQIFYIILDALVRDKYERLPNKLVLPDVIHSSNTVGKDTFSERLARISELCKSPEVLSVFKMAPKVSQGFYNLNNRRICACRTPKAASTSVERALLIMEYPDKMKYFQRMPGRSVHVQEELNNASAETCFSDGKSGLMVIRDPYSRLFSAYIDKVFLEKFHKMAIAMDVIFNKRVDKETFVEMMETKKYSKLLPWSCNQTEVTFEEFLLYVVKSRSLDSHYTPISYLCDPCQHKYNFILKQENLKSESRDFVKYIYHGNTESPPLTEFGNYSGENGIESIIVSYYASWEQWLSSSHCPANEKLYDGINRRLWQALKFLGYIDENLDFIEELFRARRPTLRKAESIIYELRANKVPFLNGEEQSLQKRKFMTEAYGGVNKRIIKMVRSLFQLDFILFGYSMDPPT